MTNPNHCPPKLVLAGIIRQVDGKHDLSADALAEAILAHPGSRWGPVATAAAAENSGAAAWPAAWPEISDNLIASLICDFSALATLTTWRCATGQTQDPVPDGRACLLAALEAAAKEGAE